MVYIGGESAGRLSPLSPARIPPGQVGDSCIFSTVTHPPGGPSPPRWTVTPPPSPTPLWTVTPDCHPSTVMALCPVVDRHLVGEITHLFSRLPGNILSFVVVGLSKG